MTRYFNITCVLVTLPLIACSSAEFRPRAVGSVAVNASTTLEALSEGRFQFRSGNFALAAGSFRRALRQSPESVEAYNGLAASYDRLRRFDLARRYYQEALAIAPDDPRVRANYATSLRMQGLEREAALMENGDVEAARATEPLVETPGAPSATVTIELPPLPVEEDYPRLERVSAGEVVLMTRRETRRPIPHRSAERAGGREGRPLPIRLIRDTGQELVWELGAAPEDLEERSPMRILNGGGLAGQAGRMKRHLRSLGWSRATVGDARFRRQRSTIVTGRGTLNQARALARALPFAPRIIAGKGSRQMVADQLVA